MPGVLLASKCGWLGIFLGIFQSLIGRCYSRAIAKQCLGGEPGRRASSPNHVHSSHWSPGNSKWACNCTPNTTLRRVDGGRDQGWAEIFMASTVLSKEEDSLPSAQTRALSLGCTPGEEGMWGSWHHKALTYGSSTPKGGLHSQAQLYPRLICVFRRAHNTLLCFVYSSCL